MALRSVVITSEELSSVMMCRLEVAIPTEGICEVSNGEWMSLKVLFGGIDRGAVLSLHKVLAFKSSRRW